MAQITGLINGENINLDIHNTAIHKALINPGIISGLAVTAGQVAIGEAFVECIRSNGEKIMVHFMNTAPLNIDTLGNKKIFVEIKQANIDNGIINAEDGSNIGEIKSADSYPSKNYIPLASVTGGVIADERKFIGKKIPDIRGQNRRPIDYSAQTFYGPEFVEGATVGLSEAWWINLHTYSSWTVDDFNYKTQLAITSQGPVTGMWIRKAVDNNTWGDWQKVFPFSATALDINGLPEIHHPTNSYDFFLVKEWQGTNKKVTLENLRKWILPRNGERHQLYDTPKHVPNGCLCVGTSYITNTYGGVNGAGWRVLHSENNSDWREVYNFPKGSSPQTKVFIIPPGFVKAEISQDWNAHHGASVEIQLF